MAIIRSISPSLTFSAGMKRSRLSRRPFGAPENKIRAMGNAHQRIGRKRAVLHD